MHAANSKPMRPRNVDLSRGAFRPGTSEGWRAAACSILESCYTRKLLIRVRDLFIRVRERASARAIKRNRFSTSAKECASLIFSR